MAAIQNRKPIMIKHGLTGHPLYAVWYSMRRRCNNPKERAFKWYGAKGIKVCQEWGISFVCFYQWAINNGWEQGLTLERIKNELGYAPSNCKFITHAKQQANRSYNYQILYNGETKTLADWSRLLNFNYSRVLQRIRAGWDFETAITNPKHVYNL